MFSEPVFCKDVELESKRVCVKKYDFDVRKKGEKFLHAARELLCEYMNIRINNVLILTVRFQVMKTLPVISSVSNQSC